MSNDQICARHWATGQPTKLCWEDGVITHLEPAVSASASLWIAPALFDVQVNGYAGVDFQQNGLSVDSLLRACRALRADGCPHLLLTLITDEWSELTNRLRQLVSIREENEELKSSILGWHIEGPFLSAEPGFHGAHNPAWMLDPAPELVRELRHVTGRDPLLLTIAPERRGAIAAIQLATSLGIVVSLGHTNAPGDVLQEAVAAGARLFTHLGNACPRELDRHDNILWRVLDTPGLVPSLIPDRIHVSPQAFRIFHRVLQDSVFYTTDAMAAAGAAPGRYTIGMLEVEVGEDQIVRQPGRSNFAGSALRPVEGVFRAASMLKSPWQEAWRRFSEAPRRLLGLPWDLGVGLRATFCIVEFDELHQMKTVRTIWNG